jgi:hypothetical protein
MRFSTTDVIEQVVRAVTLLACIHEANIFSWTSAIVTEVYRGFSHTLQESAGIWSWPHPFTSFSIRCSLIFLSFDDIVTSML